ncbi:hypothetical protein E1264_29745 [Actinomadura sp. KC216]|uniref:hypothetical protein n=1 Tax=Actinomadura sp. KC216 TaxID=2530370 RepID=UPI001043F896|nr:hypothetical protein [Actinomadura sp. KC216]TDB83104.1 hypothetical protein E1264_29745 [Actinomadura sp. KC216]
MSRRLSEQLSGRVGLDEPAADAFAVLRDLAMLRGLDLRGDPARAFDGRSRRRPGAAPRGPRSPGVHRGFRDRRHVG